MTLDPPHAAEGLRDADAAPAAAEVPAGSALWLDPRLFDPFYAEAAPRLRAYLARLTGNSTVADDLLQESFVRFLTRPLRPGSEARWRSYLFQIATNLARDRWRWERRESGFLERFAAPKSQPGGPESRLATRVDFAAAFSRLAPRDRALLWLAYVEGYEHAEIASILGLRAASVRVLLFRLRRKAAGLLPHTRPETEELP
jgi:RNA polymerase sigma-70 factor (ECF subfamily)